MAETLDQFIYKAAVKASTDGETAETFFASANFNDVVIGQWCIDKGLDDIDIREVAQAIYVNIQRFPNPNWFTWPW
jgi:hypothetical protein